MAGSKALSIHDADVVNDDHVKPELSEEGQGGVQKALILKHNLTRKRFIAAYTALFFTMFASRFSVYTALTYNAFATSTFSEHSVLAAAGIASDIAQLCAYPIIAKLEDVIGRGEGFAMSIVLLAVGSAMTAGCTNIQTYVVAGVFTAVGDTGLLLTEQVFIAETTSLVNRGLLAAIPEAVGGVVALVAGSIAAGQVLAHAGWRWGYGMWAIVLPVCAAPLVIIMLVLERRGPRARGGTNAQFVREKAAQVSRYIWVELDFPGAVLLVAGLALLLVPLSLTVRADKWKSASLVSMVVVGVVALICFAIWDARFAIRPIVPLSLMKRRTVVVACLLGAFDFLAYSVFTTFFPSFLQVAGGYAPSKAALINNSLIIAYQVTRIITGVLLRLTKRPLPWVLLGVPISILGQGLLIRFTCDEVSRTACIVAARVLVGVGRGLYHTAALVAVQADVPESELSTATALFLALMTVGSSIGQSIGGAVWRNTLGSNLSNYLPDDLKALSDKIFSSIVVAITYAKGTIARNAIDHAYRDSMSLLAIIATACMIPMLLIMFGIKNTHLQRKQF